MKENISSVFIKQASNILAATNGGLTGGQIADSCNAFAYEYNINIPYDSVPKIQEAPNKRTALYENLLCFLPEQQFKIIFELCERPQFAENEDINNLKLDLVTRYGQYNEILNEQLKEIIVETKHWLEEYPKALESFNNAVIKFNGKIFQRNMLDDLRLSLELFLKSVLNNEKSLENQKQFLGDYLKDRGTSKILSNMFITLIDYFSKYQNSYVKHNDSVNAEELEFMIELTSVFMKYLISIEKNQKV